MSHFSSHDTLNEPIESRFNSLRRQKVRKQDILDILENKSVYDTKIRLSDKKKSLVEHSINGLKVKKLRHRTKLEQILNVIKSNNKKNAHLINSVDEFQS